MVLDRKSVMERADHLVAQGMVLQAIMEYRRLLRENPEDMALMNRIGDLYVQAGRHEDAAATFKMLALHLHQDRQEKKAIALLKRLLRLTPEDQEAAHQLIEMLHAIGSPREAAAVHIQMARHFESIGDRARALAEFGQGAAADPSNLEHRAELARMFLADGQKEKAAGHFLDAAEGMALQQRFAEAHQLAAQAETLTSGPLLLLTQARIDVLAGSPDHAIAHMLKALAAYPGNAGILENLAEVEVQAGQPAQGLAHLAELRRPTDRLLPLCEQALHDLAAAGRLRLALRLFRPLARTLAAKGHGPAVIAALKSACKGQQHPVLWILHAEIALDGEQREEGLRALRQAYLLVKDRPSKILGRLLHRWIEEVEGQRQTTVQIVTQQAQQATMAIPLFSSKRLDPQAKLKLERMEEEARSQVQRGNLQGAQALFQEIIGLEPTRLSAVQGLVELFAGGGQMHKAQAQCISSAQVFSNLGRKQEARQLLDTAEGFMAGSTRGPRKMLGL